MGIDDRDWMRDKRTDWSPRDFSVPERPNTAQTHRGQLRIRVAPTLRERLLGFLKRR